MCSKQKKITKYGKYYPQIGKSLLPTAGRTCLKHGCKIGVSRANSNSIAISPPTTHCPQRANSNSNLLLASDNPGAGNVPRDLAASIRAAALGRCLCRSTPRDGILNRSATDPGELALCPAGAAFAFAASSQLGEA